MLNKARESVRELNTPGRQKIFRIRTQQVTAGLLGMMDSGLMSCPTIIDTTQLTTMKEKPFEKRRQNNSTKNGER